MSRVEKGTFGGVSQSCGKKKNKLEEEEQKKIT